MNYQLDSAARPQKNPKKITKIKKIFAMSYCFG